MWTKILYLLAVIAEFVFRLLQMKDKAAGREELIKEQQEQANADIEKAKIMRDRTDLSDELFLNPKDRDSQN